MRENTNDAITRPKDENKLKGQPLSKTIRFNRVGKSDENRSRSFGPTETCALIIDNGTNQIYKVKSLRGVAHFYNPQEESRQYGLELTDKATGDYQFKLRQVPKSAFDKYIDFLQRRVKSQLTTAEREA